MKQIAKQALSLALALVMIMSLLPLHPMQVKATVQETPMVITVSSANSMAGDTITTTIAVSGNPGITSMKLNVAFESILTLENVEYNSNFGGISQMPETLKSPVTLNWASPTANCDVNAVFATLTFRVSDTAEANTIANISITYDPDDIFNLDDTNIDCTVVNGTVSIVKCLAGDINGDYKLNNKDFTRLFQYLSNWDVEVNESCLDVNGDGNVNNKDFTRLFQYLSNWNVEINCACGTTKRCAHEALEGTEAKAASCTEDGNIAYWYCASCGKYFSDADATTETTLEAVIIPGGHTYSTSWVYDEEYHWHAATCEHTDLAKDAAEHTFGSDKVCTVCSFDSNYLYKLATPQDVKVAYDVVTWTTVPNAGSYTVVVNGDYEYVTKNVECSLTSVKNSEGSTLFADRTGINIHGKVTIVVYANDNGEYTRSDNSAEVTYYYVPDAGNRLSAKQELSDDFGLGLGYNMVESGFLPGMQPGVAVFDTGKLLAIDTLTEPDNPGGGSFAYYYTSVDDYMEQRTNSTSFAVDGGIKENKFVTAGLKANLNYGGSEKFTSHKYFASYINRTDVLSGIVSFGGQNSALRIHCLSQEFLKDICRENDETKLMSDEQLCQHLYNKYGTHTALGIVKGGYFESSYSMWTNTESDLNVTKNAFSAALSANVGTFFNVKAEANDQGDATIQTTDEKTVSLLKTSYYGGAISGTSSDKAHYSEWDIDSETAAVLSFTDKGAVDIGSLLATYEAEYGNLGLNGKSLGESFSAYVDSKADAYYHELYDQYTYDPPFDVEVEEENGKNVLVIDLSRYQIDGVLDEAGCSYLVDGIFTVYPNMLGEDIDVIKLIGAMDETTYTEKQLLDGFSLALKGKWTRDVEIVLENLGVATKSEYGIVDTTAMSQKGNVTVRYEGMNVLKDTSGIVRCYVDQDDVSYSFILDESSLVLEGEEDYEWVLGNTSIDGDAISLPVATKANYEFAGWFDGEENAVTDAYGKLDTAWQAETDTVTIYAKWMPKTYTVTLNDQGASTAGTAEIYLMYRVGYAANKPAGVEFEQISSVVVPKKTGYIFGGYYLGAIENNATPDAKPTGLQYIAADGSINNVVDGDAANMAIKAHTILYALWTPVTYTVAYDGNGGTGTVNSTEHRYNVYAALATNDNGFQKSGMSFVGWNSEKDGSGTWYLAGSSYRNLSATDGATVTLYAQWTDNIAVTLNAVKAENTYTKVFYMTPDADAIYSDKDCSNKLTKVSIPSRTEYNFGGYYDSVANNETPNPTGTNQRINASGEFVCEPAAMKDDLELVALWDLKEYTATWNSCANCTIVVNRTESTLANAEIGEITSGETIYYGDILSVVYTTDIGYKIASNGETRIEVKDGVTASDIWAKTELRTFTITYDLSLTDSDDGTGCYEDLGFTKKTYTVTYGTSYTLDVPTAKYYKFTGWYTADGKAIAYGDGKSLAKWTGLENITVYARWIKEWNGVSYGGYTYIKTTEEFRDNISYGSGPRKILLINDITFTGYTGMVWWTEDRILDGGGNTISGVSRDLSASEMHTGLFEYNFGTIRNLTINNWQLCASDHDHDISGTHKAGLLCVENRGVIENVKVTNSRVYFDEGSLSCDVQNYAYVGLICGYNTGTITNCTANGNYMNVYVGSLYQDAYAYVGGIVGRSGAGSITGCASVANTIVVTAKADYNNNWLGKCKSHGRPHLYLGGVIGYTTGTGYSGLSASGNSLSSEVSRGCDCSTNMEHIRKDIVGYSG